MEDAVYGIEMRKCIIKMPYIVSDFIVGYSQYSISLFLSYIAISDILLDKGKQ